MHENSLFVSLSHTDRTSSNHPSFFFFAHHHHPKPSARSILCSPLPDPLPVVPPPHPWGLPLAHYTCIRTLTHRNTNQNPPPSRCPPSLSAAASLFVLSYFPKIYRSDSACLSCTQLFFVWAVSPLPALCLTVCVCVSVCQLPLRSHSEFHHR